MLLEWQAVTITYLSVNGLQLYKAGVETLSYVNNKLVSLCHVLSLLEFFLQVEVVLLVVPFVIIILQFQNNVSAFDGGCYYHLSRC